MSYDCLYRRLHFLLGKHFCWGDILAVRGEIKKGKILGIFPGHFWGKNFLRKLKFGTHRFGISPSCVLLGLEPYGENAPPMRGIFLIVLILGKLMDGFTFKTVCWSPISTSCPSGGLEPQGEISSRLRGISFFKRRV